MKIKSIRPQFGIPLLAGTNSVGLEPVFINTYKIRYTGYRIEKLRKISSKIKSEDTSGVVYIQG